MVYESADKGLDIGALHFDNRIVKLCVEVGMKKCVNMCLVLMLVALTTGCANLDKTGLSTIENPVEAHTVSLHEKVKDLTLVGFSFDFRWMLTGIGYYAQGGSLLRRDAWKVILVTDTGVKEASAVMGDGCVNILAMIEKPASEVSRAHVFVLSGGNDGHSKSMLDVNGKIIGPLARNPADKEEIDLEKLLGNADFRKDFLRRHTSIPNYNQIFDASVGTEIREKFLAEMQKRFPGIAKDGKSRVSNQSLEASAESNQSTTMDKVLSNVHVMADPSLMAFPIGPALKMAGLIVASYQASSLPLNGSFEGAAFDKLEFIDRIGECHESLVGKLAKYNR